MKSVGALFFDLTHLPFEVIVFMIMHFPIEYSEPLYNFSITMLFLIDYIKYSTG